MDSGHLAHQTDPAAFEHSRHRLEDIVAMLQETARVPLEEELAVVRGVVVIGSVLEEGSSRDVRAVIARVVGPTSHTPLRVSGGHSRGVDVVESKAAVALKLPNTTEVPMFQLVGGVAQFPSGSHPDLHLHDGVSKHLGKGGRKRGGKVRVELHRGPTLKQLEVVCPEADVFVVEVAVLVLVQDIRILGRDREHPAREGDVAFVANIATAFVKAEDGLGLEPSVPNHIEQLRIRCPVIRLGLSLDNSPPDVDGDPVRARHLECV
mmetsp:Transcript_64592/g.152794  ORF Transcript_64592/g.152794 Transcript_64592/m.152794 type:complete len:264 (+) Transcript_64592:479-1270(+)